MKRDKNQYPVVHVLYLYQLSNQVTRIIVQNKENSLKKYPLLHLHVYINKYVVTCLRPKKYVLSLKVEFVILFGFSRPSFAQHGSWHYVFCGGWGLKLSDNHYMYKYIGGWTNSRFISCL